MGIKIKEKIVNGEKVKGLINENLKEIAPFVFEKIKEIKVSGEKYYICTLKDGRESLYDYQGYCRIDYTYGYKNLKILKNGTVSANKNNEIGILTSIFEWKNGWEKPSGIHVEEVYKFGKCHEIEELEDGTVKLIKHTKGKDRIGYFYHPNISGRVEPNYLSYDYFKIGCRSVGLYELSNGREKGNPSYTKSDVIEHEKLTFNVELVKYSKEKNKKELFGINQKTVEKEDYDYNNPKFVELLAPEYSKIDYDKENQLFMLEKNVDGKIKKGFIGVSFEWFFGGQGWLVWGYPNFKIEVNFPCEYDEIKFLPKVVYNNTIYFLAKKDDKYGVYKYNFEKQVGDYWYDQKVYSKAMLEEIAPCIYDSIEVKDPLKGFIGKIKEEEQIITDNKTKGKYVTINNNYKKVKILDECIYLCELKNGQNVLVLLSKSDSKWGESEKVVPKEIPCDNVELLKYDRSGNASYYQNIIKVTKDGIIDLYILKDGNAVKIEEDILDIIQDEQEPEYFKVIKKNKHITYLNYNGKIFSTEDLNIVPNNLDVKYLKSIYMFKVMNNGIVNLYNNKCGCGNKIYENRDFIEFDAASTYYYQFVGYTERTDDGYVSKLMRVNLAYSDANEIELLKGTFNVENIFLGGQRIIYSIYDNQAEKLKYGVIETIEGNSCVECEYDSITFDSHNKVIIATLNDERFVFDIDGFTIEIEDYDNKYKKIDSNPIKLSLRK